MMVQGQKQALGSCRLWARGGACAPLPGRAPRSTRAVSGDLRHVGQVAEHLCAPQFPARTHARPCLPRWRVCSRACVWVDETDTLGGPQLGAVLRNTGSCSSPRCWARGAETVPRSKDTAENQDPQRLADPAALVVGSTSAGSSGQTRSCPRTFVWGPFWGLHRLDPPASFTFLTDKGFLAQQPPRDIALVNSRDSHETLP